MAILRLTHYFLTFLKETKIPKRNGSGEVDGIIFITEFPFTFDAELALPRSVRNTDVVLDQSGNPSVTVPITSYGRYDKNKWSIGLGVNGEDIWDGITRPTEDGQYIYKTAQIAIMDAGFFPDGRGYLSIDKTASNLGILDTVEISIKSASAYSPWIYYGNIPQRQQIALEQFGRNASGLGGIPESLTPSQAIGYTYYVDFNASQESGSNIVPFPSAFFLAGSGTGGSLSERFFMGDILDGDGRLAVRSSVIFKILTISMNFAIAGEEIPATEIIQTGGFKTLNYKKMEYGDTTYDTKKVIEKTRYYIGLQGDKKFNDIYYNLSETIRMLLGDQIDFSNTIFNIYMYFGNTSILVSKNITSKEGLVSAIKSISVLTGSSEKGTNLTSLQNMMSGQILEDAKADDGAGNYNAYRYSQIVFGDMQFVSSQGQFALTMEYELNGTKKTVPIKTSATHILLSPQEDRSLGLGVFGESVTYIYGFENSSVYGFQFIESLTYGVGKVLQESDLYQEFSFMNAPVVAAQCKRVTEPKSVEDNVTIDGVDNDNDGMITFIDRIYDLYENFNPATDAGDDSFFGSRGVEMRYWRRMCPIGQLYSFYGKIVTSEKKRGNNYLIRASVVMENPDYESGSPVPRFIETGVPNNEIYIYYESGARSNIANTTTEGVFRFRGRLFYPPYWLGKDGRGIQLANGINLNNPDELVAWYRMLPDTAKDLLESVAGKEPVLIVRTNVMGGADEQGSDGSGYVSNVFLNTADTKTFFKISQGPESVEDEIIKVPEVTEDSFSISNVGSVHEVVRSVNQSAKISFQYLEFNIEIGSEEDAYGEYEYEIYYQTSDSNQYSLRKFWSAEAFLNNTPPTVEGNIAATVRIPLNTTFQLGAEQSWQTTDENAGRLFDIRFPYRKTQKDSLGVKHFFTWNPADYQVQVFLNGKIISSSQSLSSDVVSAAVSPSFGQILLREAIDVSKDSLYISFTNITGDQGLQKTGTVLGIKWVGMPKSGVAKTAPIFSNVKINESFSGSVERVDGNFYNPAGSSVNRDHFIAPAFGYAVLAGSRNWDISIDRNSTAGGAGNVRINGNLISPIWYFDAFSTDVGEKLISEASSSRLAAIDRVYSNMVSVGTQPYVEIESIGYTPPPPEIVSKVASLYDKVLQRYTLAYNVDQNIQVKFSHTGFRDRDSSYKNLDELNRSQRQELVVYSGPEREEEFAISSDGSFGITGKDPKSSLVALRVNGHPSRTETSIQNTAVFELQAQIGSSYVPFGYQRFDGKRTGLLVRATADGARRVGLSQLPLLDNVSRLKLVPFSGANFDSVLEKVSGVFVDSLVEGQAPTLYQSRVGTCLMFFSQRNGTLDMITGLISREQTARWSRPATKAGEINAYKPVPILTGYVNPLVLQKARGDMIHLFLFNNKENAIDLLSIPYTAFEKFAVGITEDPAEYSPTVGTSPVGYSDLIRDPNQFSWKKVFSEGRALYSIVFDATQDYFATMTSDGGIYLASVSTHGKLRLLYSPSVSKGEFGTKNTTNPDFDSSFWREFGVDIFDEDGHLSKVLKVEDIYSIALSSVPSGGTLELYIVTKDLKLYLFRIPTALTSVADRYSDKDGKIKKKIQKDMNNTVPILVVGNGLKSSEHLIADGAILEDFQNQLPSIQWFPNGELYIVYYKNSKVKGIKSTSGGSFWREVHEI